MERASVVCLWLYLLLPAVILASNIDIRQPVVRRGRTDAYFGYSVAQFLDSSTAWIIVGAPRDNTTTLDALNVSRPGAVYRCGVTQNSDCTVIDIDTNFTYHLVDRFFGKFYEKRDRLQDQWLGSSVAAAKNGPIVACAHRYVDLSGTSRQWYPVGRCAILNNAFEVQYKRDPCNDPTTPGVRGTYYCQTGTSAQISEDGKVSVWGSPGAYKWQGIVQFVEETDFTDTQLNEGVAEFDYMGYSSDFGQFGWEQDLYYVALGAPRYDGYFGRVVVFDYNSATLKHTQVWVKDGTQFGAYFGHSVAAADLNNDGYDDLLVGAPFFSDSLYEQGQVSVFMNNQIEFDTHPVLLTGNIVAGQFGYAIAKAGDLNGDSFDDVVISAPYAKTGGIVYVYYGSVSGIVNQPSQIIEAEQLNYNGQLMGFGVSLSAGMDLDSNTYPDVLVGAYLSDDVVLLRSRPIADVEGKVTFNPQFVNYPNATKFEVNVCLKYSGRGVPGQLAMGYSLSLEQTRVKAGLPPRATFTVSSSSVVNENITATRDKELCKNFSLVLQPDIIDLVNPIVALLTYYLPPEGKLPSDDGKPDTTQSLYPVLRSTAAFSSQAYLLRGCGNDVTCIPDLQLSSVEVKVSGKDSNIILVGDTTEMTVFVAVTNKGENAYNARLIASFPSDLKFIGLDEDNLISCDNSKDGNGQNRVICVLGNPFQSGKSVTFGLKINVQSLSSATHNFTVLLEAQSDNPENKTTLADNKYETDSLVVQTQAAYGFNDGRPATAQIEFDINKPTVDVSRQPNHQAEIGMFVNHTYSVINKGPSSVNFLNLKIQWPWKVKKGNGTYLLYITDIKVSPSTQCNTDIQNPLELKVLVVGESNGTILEGEVVTRDRRGVRKLRASGQTCPEEVECD